MSDLETAESKVLGALHKAAEARNFGWVLVKLFFIVAASAIAGVAQFASADGELTFWTTAGMFAAATAGIGGALVLFSEKNSIDELVAAHQGIQAIKIAREELNDAVNEFSVLDKTISRLINLYVSMKLMRSVLETASGRQFSDKSLIDLMLSSSSRSLKIALDFQLDEHWTIAVYRAEKDEARDQRFLRCISTERSLPCDISKARTWDEGSMPAGACLASKNERVVADAAGEDMDSVLDAGAAAKRDDRTIYRSMFCAPVLVHGRERAWGVVMATSSRPRHFDGIGEEGVRTAEAVRLLADMIALAIATHKPDLTEAVIEATDS
jgi:hypothetical protein